MVKTQLIQESGEIGSFDRRAAPGDTTIFLLRPMSGIVAASIAAAVVVITLGFDLSQPLGDASSIPYVVLPLLGLLARSSSLIVTAAMVGTVFTGVGLMLSPSGADHETFLLNRGMSVALIWVIASIALRHLYVGARLQQSLRQQATTDQLTGLANRHHFFSILKNELQRFDRYGDCFALILIDVDHFKRVNDAYGHVAGDIESWRCRGRRVDRVV